jgi:hypothetical protein
MFAQEVATAQHEKEEELREKFGLRPHPSTALAVSQRAANTPQLSTPMADVAPEHGQQEKND